MDAGAAGFATSFAVTHLRRRRPADPQPVGRPRPSSTPCVDAVGRRRPRRSSASTAAATTCSFARHLRPAARARRAVHLHRVLTTPNGAPPQGRCEMHRGGLAEGAEVWPQVSCRAADVLDDHGRAVHAQHQPGLRRADAAARSTSAAPPTPTRRGASGCATAGTPAQGLPPRWDTYEIMESAAHPELRRAAARRHRRRARRRPVRRAARPRPRRARPADLRVKAVLANDDADGVAMLLNEDRLHARPVRRRRPRRPAVRRPAGHRPARQLGARPRRAHARAGGPQAHQGAGRPVRLRRPGRASRRGHGADVVVFDPDTVAPGPAAPGRATSRPTPSASPPTSPSGMRHVFVNGTRVIVDGELQDDCGGRPSRAGVALRALTRNGPNGRVASGSRAGVNWP